MEGQGEVVCRRFSIVVSFSLGSLVKNSRDRILIPQDQFNKTKQHTHAIFAHAGPRELDGPLGGGGWGFGLVPGLYHPFGKGPGQHRFGALKIKSTLKCENERTVNQALPGYLITAHHLCAILMYLAR